MNGVRINRDSRLVQVFPCYHIIESDHLEAWLKKCVNQEKTHVAGFFSCPICQCRVTFCPRFGNILKKNAKIHNQIKTKRDQQTTNGKGEMRKLEDLIKLVISSGELSASEATYAVGQMKKQQKNPTQKAGSWFSNEDALISRLIEIFLCSLRADDGLCADVALVYLRKLYTPNGDGEGASERLLLHRNNTDYMLACILHLHKLSRRDGVTKSIAEVLYSVMTGTRIEKDAGRELLRSMVTQANWRETLMVEKIHLDSLTEIAKAWDEHRKSVTWLACPQGVCLLS